MVDWWTETAMCIMSIQEKLCLISAFPLVWSTWELHCSCDTPQYFHGTTNLKGTTIYFPCNKSTLAHNTCISCFHFAHRFLMGIDSQTLRFFLEQVSITKPEGTWHVNAAWDPGVKGPHSLCTGTTLKRLFQTWCFPQEFDNWKCQESSCYWLHTVRIK